MVHGVHRQFTGLKTGAKKYSLIDRQPSNEYVRNEKLRKAEYTTL